MTRRGRTQPAAPSPPTERGLALRLLRSFMLIVSGLLVAVALGITTAAMLGVTVDLSAARGWVEKTATTALGRRVRIDGPLILLPALNPTVQIEGLQIGNPLTWSDPDYLARADKVRGRFALVPLLRGELRIDSLSAEGLDLQLKTSDTGEVNWQFGPPTRSDQTDATKAAAGMRLLEVGTLQLRAIDISHRDAANEVIRGVRLDQIDVSAMQGRALSLAARGSVAQSAFHTKLATGSIADLFEAAQPLPLELELKTDHASLRVTGSIEEPQHGRGLALDINLQVAPLAEFTSLFAATPGPIDRLAVKGQLNAGNGHYRFESLEAQLGTTQLGGHLELDLSGNRPLLTGLLRTDKLDISPFLEAADAAANAGSDDEPPTLPRTRTADPAWKQAIHSLNLDGFKLFDVELTLGAAQIIGAATTLTDTQLGLSVQDGSLAAPLSLTLAGVPLQGKAELGSDAGEPQLSIDLAARGHDLGQLPELLLNAKGVEGRFDRARLRLSARGDTPHALVSSAALAFSLTDASLSYGHNIDGHPVEFTLDRLTMNYPSAQPGRIDAHGSLLGEPFSVHIRSGSFVEKFIDKRWAFELDANGGGAHYIATGDVVSGQPLRIAMTLSGEHIGGLAAWIGVPEDAPESYRLVGELGLSNTAIELKVSDGQLADSRFSAELGIGPYRGKPLTRLVVDADRIDLTAIRALLPSSTAPSDARPGGQGYAIELPILPKGIELFDSDIALSIDTLNGSSLTLRNLTLSSHVRGGYVEHAPFQFELAGARLHGSLGADLRGERPKLDVALKARSLDVGRLLKRLELIDGLDLKAGQFELSAALEGSTVAQMLARSTVSTRVRGGLWRLHDADLNGDLNISIDDARLRARGARPTVLTLNGKLDGIPLTVELNSNSLASLARPGQQLQVDATIALAGADIKLDGSLPLPVRGNDLSLKLALSGQRMADLNPLFNVSLPPWGPYSLRGEFGSRSGRYFVRELQLGIGSSALSGSLQLDTAPKPPRLRAGLTAPLVQLDDFNTGSWSAKGQPQATSEPPLRRKARMLRALLSPEVMRSLDAAMSMRVKRVVSGNDRLGSGRLSAKLDKGRLSVDPLSVELPGGSARLGFTLQPGADEVLLTATAQVEQLNYNYLAHRIDPKSTVTGLISVDADVTTRGRDFDHIMESARGHINFAIWPQGIDAGIFDLWATNLLIYMLPLVDVSAGSAINCVVTGLQLKDGLMEPTALLIDTTRVQASGTGIIDFRQRSVDLQLAARPKRPQLFAARTPLRIQGEFSDFSVGLRPGSLLGTSVRLLTSPVVVPFQWVFSDRPAADGEAACQKVWDELQRRE